VDALTGAGEAASIDDGNEAAEEVEVEHDGTICVPTGNDLVI
jgi:hypothetical protein